LGDRKGVQPVKNLCHLSAKVLFRTGIGRKIEEEPPDPGSHGEDDDGVYFFFIVFIHIVRCSLYV